MASSPAAWPLLSRVLSEVKSANDLVRWGLDKWGCRRVVGLRELRVAAVLFASSQDAGMSSAAPDWEGFLAARFEEEVPCAHLEEGDDDDELTIKRSSASSSSLDLAIRFGHADLARCLQARGLGRQALRPEDLQSLPVGSLAKLPLEVPMRIDGGEEVQGEIWIGEWYQERSEWHRACWCRPVNGDWQQVFIFEDDDRALHPWQQRLGDASAAAGQEHWASSDWKAPTAWARALVDTPAIRAVLALAAEGLLPDLDEDAKLRLLDAALLLGEPEAAAALAGSCGPRRPLRIWDFISVKSRRYVNELAIGYAEAHLRAGLRDVRGLGFQSAGDVAELAVEAGAPGLARAVAELLPEGAWEMELFSVGIAERGPHGNAILREGALAALEALGPPLQGCSVVVLVRSAATQQCRALPTPPLLLPAILGDQPAAMRLVRAGFTLQGSTGSGGSSRTFNLDLLGDPAWEALRFIGDNGDVFISLKPVASRLEVAERTLRLLFAAAASRSLCAAAATRRRGLLGRPWLLEHVAGFAAVWTDGEAVLRQELTAMIGRDPLRGLSLRSGQRGAPTPVTAATAQASPAAPPGHPSSEQVMQQAAGGRSAEPQGYSAAYPVGEPHSELQAARSSAGPLQEPEGAEGRGSVEPQVRSTAEPEAEAHVEQQAASSSAGPGPAQEGEGVEGQADKDLALEAAEFRRAVQESESDAVQVEQENLHWALLLSKEEAHGGQEAFNGEVYALLRLNKHSPETLRVLQESEELRPCREHVAAAGCELQPAWAGGALLCVPMTQELYRELDLELRRHHVLLLKSDVSRLEAALRALPYRKRPLVKPDHRAKPYSAAKDGAPEEAEQPSGRAVAATAEDRAATEAGRQSSAAVATTAEGRSAGEARQPSAEGFAPNEARQSGGAAVAAMAEEGLAFKRARLLSSTTAAATTEDPAAAGSVQPCGAAAAAAAEEGAASDEARQPSGMAAAATAREPAPASGEQPSGAAAAAEEADEAFHAEHNAHVVDRDALFRSWGITVEELGTFLTIKVDGSSAAASSDVTGSAPAAVHRESPGAPQRSGQLASHAPLHARNPRRYRPQ